MRGVDIEHAVVPLDGGLATALEARGHDLSDALWSARLLVDAPEEIVQAHRAFFEAGARVATTASYQASFEGFAAHGVGRAEAARLLRGSVELARAAAAELDEPGWVAASVGPYGAILADGSEFRGRYGLSVAELVSFHRPRIEVLAEAAPDVLALETVPDVDEAEALVRAVAGIDIPAWLSYTIAGDRTRAGQPLEQAFAVAGDSPEVVAVGINCCHPSDADRAVALAREVTGKPVVVYPNSGEDWDHERGWSGGAAFAPEQARRWYAAGARLIGGCCRVGPAEIRALRGALHTSP